jgi:hypothetical protein
MGVGKLLDLCLFVTERLHALVVAVLLATAIKLALVGVGTPPPEPMAREQTAGQTPRALARLPLP